MPRLSTIKDSLEERLSKSLSEVSAPTSFSDINLQIGQLPPFDFLTEGFEEIDDADHTMLQGIGKALWMGGTHFAETATFGVGKLAGVHAPEPETLPGKIGAAVGGAAGFYIAFGAGKAAFSALGRAFAGKASSKALANTMKGGIKEILSKKGAVQYSGTSMGTLGKSEDAAKLFETGVLEPGLIKRIVGFEKGFKTAAQRQEFALSVEKEAGKLLTEMGERKGFKLSENAARDITKLVGEEWAKIGGRPISDIQGLLARKLGDGKAANFYSHLFEEGVIFAGVENVMHGIEVAAGDTEADFLGTTAHAFVLGHVLGGVRFVPGGVRGGTLGLFNKSGRERAAALVSRAPVYAKSYNTATSEGREAIRAQYKMFASLRENPMNGSGSLSRELNYQASRNVRHSKIPGEDYSLSSLEKILATGTKEEKIAVAEIMRDGLGFVSKQLQKEWRGDFIRLWGEDLAKSTPRMLLGGLAMGNVALFDENIPIEDKLITFATGAFLLKHGKELTYRGADGSYEMRQSLMEFPEKLTNLKDMYDTLGVDIIDPLWFKMVGKITDQNRISNIGMGVSDQNPEAVQDLINIANYRHPKSDRPMFLKDKDSPVKESNKKGKKPSSDIESLYRDFVSLNSKENIIDEGLIFKEWEELHPKEKMQFKELLETQNIWDTMDVYDVWVNANVSRFNKVRVDMVTAAKEAADELKTGELPIAVPGTVKRKDGQVTYRFKEINVGEAKLTDGQKHAFQQYNALIKLIESGKTHEIDRTGGPIYLNRENSGLQAFADRIERSVDELNDNLGFAGIERKVAFDDGWLRDGMRLLDLRTSIKQAATKIPNWFKDLSSDEGKILRRVFYDTATGTRITDKILVPGNKTAQEFANTLLPLIELLDVSRDSRIVKVGKKEQKASVEDVRALMEIFTGEGITEFHGNRDLNFEQNSRGKRMFVKQVRHHILRDTLKDTRIFERDADGKAIGMRRLDATDVAIIQRFIDWGLQNNSLTIKPIQSIMFDMEKSGIFSKISTDGFESVRSSLRESGKDDIYISNVENIFNLVRQLSGDKETGTFGDAFIKELNDVIKPYLRTLESVDGVEKQGGILHESKEEQVNITLDRLVGMVAELSFIKTGILPTKARKMLKSMDEDLIASESETKRMIGVLMHELAYNGGDQIKVYSLAVEHGLWNPMENKFNDFTGKEGETNLNKILKSLLNSAKRDWGMERDAIDELIATREEMDASQTTSGFRNQSISNLIQDYTFGGEFTDNKTTGLTHSEQIQQLFYTQYFDKPNAYGKFAGDLIDNILDNNPGSNRNEVAARVANVVLTNHSMRRIRRLTFNASAQAKNGTWSDGTVKESTAMGLIGEAIGEEHVGGRFANIVMVESEGIGRDGKLVNLSNETFYDSAVERMFKGDYAVRHEIFGGTAFENQKLMTGDTNIPYVLYRFGGSNWAYGIERNPETMGKIAKSYVEYLEELVVDKVLDKGAVAEIIKDNKITHNTETGEYTMGMPSAAELYTEKVGKIMDDLTIGKILGHRWWIDGENPGLREAEGKDMANILKRAPLFNNLSANSLTSDIVKQFSQLIRDKSLNFDGADIVANKLQEYGEGKINEVVVRDEIAGGIDGLFSVMHEQLRQYRNILDRGDLNPTDRLRLEKEETIVKEAIEAAGDSSEVDSVTFVDPNLFRALSFLFGATDGNEIGGIKPIVLKYDGKKTFIVEKTSFVKNEKIQEIFNRNKDVGFITFTSASKKVGENYGEGYNVLEISSLADLVNIGTKYKRTVMPEDVKLISIKGDKDKATLPPNHTAHMKSSQGMSDFFDYYINQELTRSQGAMRRLKNPDNYHNIIAEFRHQVRSAIGELNSDIDVSTNQLGVEDMWAEARGLPHIFRRNWANRLKKKYVDNIIRLKVNGGQGVLAPDIGLKIQEVPIKGARIKGFTTKLGSTYVVEEGGQTTRTKAARPQHPGDSGLKETSSKTVYMSERNVRGVFERPFGALQTWFWDKKTKKELPASIQMGETGMFVGSQLGGKTFNYASKIPKKGTLPVEVWYDAKGNVVKYHVGNKITEVRAETSLEILGGADRLKHTLLDSEGNTWNHGEVEIGFSNREKEIDPSNVRLINRHGNKKDEVVYDVKGMRGWDKSIRNLGQLYDWATKLKGDYQVAIVVERNPHTKPDSILVLGLKGFRGEVEGNVTVVNSGDVKRALEGDYDIDTANFWWDVPESVMREYISGRGTVRDSIPIKPGENASYAGLKFGSQRDRTIYAERMQQAKYAVGTIMNAQRVVQWLSHYNSPSFGGEKTDGPKFQVGKNRFAILRGDINETHQRIANLNQTALDAPNGFDMSLLKDYNTIMADILFHPTHGLFKVAKFTDKTGEFTVLTGQDGILGTGERQIISNITRPYRDLMSLSNKIYESGKGKKVGWDDMISGIREFDEAMRKAEENAFLYMDKAEADQIKKQMDFERKTVYNGFNSEARLFNSKKSTKLRNEQNLLPYDRLMARLMHINDVGLDFTETRIDKSNNFADEISTLTETEAVGDAYRKLADDVADAVKLSAIANKINERIESLYKLRSNFSNPSSRQYYSDRIKKLKEARDKATSRVSERLVNDKRYKRLRGRILDRWKTKERWKLKKRKRETKQEWTEEEVTRNAKASMKEHGIPIQTVRDTDVISAVAVNEAMGNFAYRNEADLGLTGTQYEEMNRAVAMLRKDFAQSWVSKNSNEGRWVNEDMIYSEFLERIDIIAENYTGGSPQMRNVMLARLMTPNVDITGFGTFRGMIFPLPEHRRYHKFVNLGLRWNKTRNPKDIAQHVTNTVASAYSKALLRFSGSDTSLYNGKFRPISENDLAGTFYLDPFEYSKGHSRDMFLGAVTTHAKILYGKDFARLDEYEKLHLAFGTGLIRDIINNEQQLNISHSAVTAMSKYGGYHYPLNGYMGGVQKAHDMGAGVYISTKGERSVIGEVFEEYESAMNLSEGRESRTPVDFVKDQVKAAKEACI
tara:strand:- start:6547 stop:15474 length:8928 start_codon:yes stop_codon:yes gene_type:complete